MQKIFQVFSQIHECHIWMHVHIYYLSRSHAISYTNFCNRGGRHLPAAGYQQNIRCTFLKKKTYAAHGEIALASGKKIEFSWVQMTVRYS